MADNDVEVKLGAETGPLKDNVSDAASSIKESLDKIATALSSFTAQNKRTTEEALKNNADLSRSFLELKGSLTGGFNAIAGVVERVRGVIGLLAGALAGGMLFKESVGEMLHFEDEVRTLSISFGMASDKATTMAVALKLAGNSADEYAYMALRVGRQVKTQADEFDRLGVKIRDANGEFLPMDTILQNVFTRMQDFKAGTDQNQFALTTVGRSAKDFAKEMLNLSMVTERAKQLQQEFGIEMGPERQAEIERYKIEVNAFKVAVGSIGDKIGEAVMPQLMELAKFFNEYGPAAAQSIVGAVGRVVAAMLIAGTAAKDLAIHFAEAMVNLTTSARSATAEIVADMLRVSEVLTGVYQGIRLGGVDDTEKLKNAIGGADVKKRAQETAADVEAIWAKTFKSIENLFTAKPPSAAGPTPGLGSGGKSFTPKPTPGSDDRLASWQDELRQMEEAEGYFHEFSKAQEAQFWRDKLALIKGNGDVEIKLRRDVARLAFDAAKADAREQLATALATFQAEIDAAKNDKDQQIAFAHARTETARAAYGEQPVLFQAELDKELKLREDWVKKEAEIMKVRTQMQLAQATFEVQMEQAAADQSLALRQITADRKFAIEQDLENKLYAQKLEALQKELAGLDSRTEEYLTVSGQIETLEQEHQLKLTDIANKAELERKQYALQAAQSVQDAFATLLTDLETHTKSLKQTMLDFFKSIGSEISKLASQNIAKMLLGPGTTGGGFLNSIFGSMFGGGTAGAGSTAADAALVKFSGTTLLADTGLTAFITALTSATAAAATFGATAATSGVGGGGIAALFAGGVASFAVGTPYVPQDTLALVHRGERIIPAAYNTGRDSNQMLNVTNHFHVSGPIDSRTQDQIALAAARSIQKASRRIG